MEAVAKLNNLKGSARKVRLVADLIRGTEVDKALAVLKFDPKHCSTPLEKLLLSAIANWESKNSDSSVEDENLFIKTIFVDGGKVLKRIQPAPQGRAHRIRKRSSHVTLVVDSKKEIVKASEKASKASDKK